jgi:HAD superfamily hydrolase (TIGR01509 family)
MLQAVLFDLDGLLADSEPLQKAAWHAYLSQHGHALDEALMDRMFGLRLIDSAALVRETFALPFTVEQVMSDRDLIFLSSLQGVLQPMTGARLTVLHMRQRDLRTALATSGHRRYVALALQEIGLADAFDVIVTGDTVERGKPAPDIFLRAAELLNVVPQRCVVVEDAPHGIAAAKAAGMLAVAVPNELTRTLDFSAADVVCPSLAAFVRWLDQHQQEHADA